MKPSIVIAKHAINGTFQSLRATGSPREGMVTTDAMEWIVWTWPRGLPAYCHICCKRAGLERAGLWPVGEWFPAELADGEDDF